MKMKGSEGVADVRLRLVCGDNSEGQQQDTKGGYYQTKYHRSKVIDMVQDHASGFDMCLVGPNGCGKTSLANHFADLLHYNVEVVHLYKGEFVRCTDWIGLDWRGL